jgi:hypothetical protein
MIVRPTNRWHRRSSIFAFATLALASLRVADAQAQDKVGATSIIVDLADEIVVVEADRVVRFRFCTSGPAFDATRRGERSARLRSAPSRVH